VSRRKHLPGRHNQESHGDGGGVGGRRSSRGSIFSRRLTFGFGDTALDAVAHDGNEIGLSVGGGHEVRLTRAELGDLSRQLRNTYAWNVGDSITVTRTEERDGAAFTTLALLVEKVHIATEADVGPDDEEWYVKDRFMLRPAPNDDPWPEELQSAAGVELTDEQLHRLLGDLDVMARAQRIDTGAGTVDMYVDGKTSVLKPEGGSELALDRRSVRALSAAISALFETVESDQGGALPVGELVERTVQTSEGAVRLTLRSGGQLVIQPPGVGEAISVRPDKQDEFLRQLELLVELSGDVKGRAAHPGNAKGGAGMATKSALRFEIKDAEQGTVSAVFATFNVIDSDGDVTVPGAFEDGAQMAISAYGHTSWQGALPVGIAKIRTTGTEAILDGQFFMDTEHGRDTFRTVKRLHDAGLGEWSYGYDVVKHTFGEHSGRKARFLQKLLVHEASPVLVGAGVNTRTLAAKSGSTRPSGRSSVTALKSIRPHETDVVNRRWDPAAELADLAEASLTDLRSMAAYVNTDADPETKAAYGMLHHHGPNGPANARACILHIARLNGAAGGTELGETERKAVYDHLAAHLRDADREPPELRAAGGTKQDGRGPFGAYLDDVVTSLVGVSDALASTDRAVALRATKGRSISKGGVEYLGWLDEDLMALHVKLRSLIDSPDDDAAREFMRFVALRQH
jgi:hypothetical protein